MSKLVIKRANEWFNKYRDIRILIDDKEVGKIGNGEVKEFAVDVGKHTLKAKVDWCGSNELNFEVTADKNIVVELSGFEKRKWISPAVLIVLFLSTFPDDVINKELIFLCMAAYLVYLFYYMTFGRNKYLRLKKV